MGVDLEQSGPVARLTHDYQGHPRADAVAVRFSGALHAAVLTGRDPELASEYPAAKPDWDIARVWPIARAFLEREGAWVRAFIASAPQTNEVRRTIALLPGFLAAAERYPGPIDTLELGASAGLNLHWDRYHYRTAHFAWGDADSPVVVDTDWSGPVPPLSAAVTVRSRAGCDLNPLDIRAHEQRLRLRAYIWADQPERLRRFDAAAAYACEQGVHVDKADAAQWIAERLSARPSDGLTLVYHSVFLQYPPRATRTTIREAIEAAGARATARAPLAWLRLEAEALLEDLRESPHFLVDLTTWPGGERRRLAFTDGHARSVEALSG
jgi:hypothetical protein